MQGDSSGPIPDCRGGLWPTRDASTYGHLHAVALNHRRNTVGSFRAVVLISMRLYREK